MRVWTTFTGEIAMASQGAAALLHISATSLRRRAVDQFFDGNRRQLFTTLDRVARGHADVFSAVLRPRERRPVPVSVRVEPDPLNAALAVWTFTVAADHPLFTAAGTATDPTGHGPTANR